MNNFLQKSSLNNSIEKIYDLHAPNMYGCIYKIVNDKLQAEKILSLVFQVLYNHYSNDVQTKTAPIWFIKYAMKSTFSFLKLQDENNKLSSNIVARINALTKEIKVKA